MPETQSNLHIANVCKDVGGLNIVDVYQLEDGRMEVIWSPVDRAIDDELAYLAATVALPVSRTRNQASIKNDLIHYLFNRENLWYGIRCPKEVWRLFMKSKDIPDKTVDAFINTWTTSPVKRLIDKELVDAVRGIRPWTGLE